MGPGTRGGPQACRAVSSGPVSAARILGPLRTCQRALQGLSVGSGWDPDRWGYGGVSGDPRGACPVGPRGKRRLGEGQGPGVRGGAGAGHTPTGPAGLPSVAFWGTCESGLCGLGRWAPPARQGGPVRGAPRRLGFPGGDHVCGDGVGERRDLAAGDTGKM